MNAPTHNVISIRDVSKSFKGTPVLKKVTLAIAPGRTYGLVGANGSGKSVLLKLMCGFIRPDEGEVVIDPAYLSSGRTFPEGFGVTINGPAYLPNLSAEANLMELAAIRGKITIDQVREALQLLGLETRPRQKARTFSLGMKQKLSIAQAIMEDPAVLLLDEPFNGLDESSVVRVKEILRNLRAKGRTIVFTSHNRQDIDELCDELLVIDSGSIRAETRR